MKKSRAVHVRLFIGNCLLSDAAVRVGLHRFRDIVYCPVPRKLADVAVLVWVNHMDSSPAVCVMCVEG